jgi:DivIVA domain-containing protein
MRLPDGAKSRALLIGTSEYDHLDKVPAAKNNVEALTRVLVERTGIPIDNCTRLTDVRELDRIGAAVVAAAEEAEDLLLVYFTGHGLIDSEARLNLALPQTSQALVPWSGIPFEFMRTAIQDAKATAKVIILDSCYSGLAARHTLGDRESDILGQIGVYGHFTLTSSAAFSPSKAFEGHRHTAFTQALLDVFEHGVADAGELLTLGDVYRELLRLTAARGLPQPQKCDSNTANQLALVENRRSRAPRPTVLQPPPPEPQPEPEREPAVMSAQEVRDIRFATVRLTEGYDEDEVDAFLDRVLLALVEPADGPQRLTAEEVHEVLFTTTRLREGYDMAQVDEFLDLVAAELDRRKGLGSGERRTA